MTTTATSATSDTTRGAVPYSMGTEPPAITLPEGACDCHMHFFDERFPYASDQVLRHPTALAEDYRRLQQRLGLERCVLVQPSSYGTDNRVMLAGLAMLGKAARGVAVIDESATDAELARLVDAGVAGLRFNLVQKGATSLETLAALAPRIRELGWHAQVHLPAPMLSGHWRQLLGLGITLVVDHIARVESEPGYAQATADAVDALLDSGRCWLKLSGAYIASNRADVDFADLDPHVQRFVQRHEQRLVWGSDWPHVTETPKPDDARLLGLLERWVPQEQARQRILASNPASLYRF